MGLPTSDWQFWIATAVAAAALFVVIRPFLPRSLRRKGAKEGACPGCPSGSAAQRPAGPQKAALTIEGRRVEG
jgi:hypothetical protein